MYEFLSASCDWCTFTLFSSIWSRVSNKHSKVKQESQTIARISCDAEAMHATQLTFSQLISNRPSIRVVYLPEPTSTRKISVKMDPLTLMQRQKCSKWMHLYAFSY